MQKILKRIAGILIALIAAMSLVLTLNGMFKIWRQREPIQLQIQKDLGLISSTLETTDQGLFVIQDALKNTNSNLSSLEETILGIAQAVHNADPLLESLQVLTEENIPETITATQTSLKSAQRSAVLIEGVLVAISKIPFFPGGPYEPEVPLNVAMAEISTDLELIREPLKDISQSLDTNHQDIADIETALVQTSLNLGKIQTGIEDALKTIETYQIQSKQYQTEIQKIYEQLPRWISILAAVLIFMGIWLGILQIQILVSGIRIAIKS
jgi:septal ring factor EnvC (AmiA/AmiB activator)